MVNGGGCGGGGGHEGTCEGSFVGVQGGAAGGDSAGGSVMQCTAQAGVGEIAPLVVATEMSAPAQAAAAPASAPPQLCNREKSSPIQQ